MSLGYKFVESESSSYLFDPTRLKKWSSDVKQQYLLAQQKQITTFSLDTGSLLIFDYQNLEKLMRLINYDSLIDASLMNELDNYFDEINRKLSNKAWAYVVSNSSYPSGQFEGDGAYILE